MGCDIHIVLERHWKERDLWVGLHEFPYMPAKALNTYGVTLIHEFVGWNLCTRDYNFFWALAGVRGGKGPPGIPRGLPHDASTLPLVTLDNDRGAHSHSWMSLSDLIPIIIRCKLGGQIPDAVANKLLNKPETNIVDEWIERWIELEEYGDYRIGFAFDN